MLVSVLTFFYLNIKRVIHDLKKMNGGVLKTIWNSMCKILPSLSLLTYASTIIGSGARFLLPYIYTSSTCHKKITCTGQTCVPLDNTTLMDRSLMQLLGMIVVGKLQINRLCDGYY
jgi:hypothetical protein